MSIFVIEGPDKLGKTTLAKNICTQFKWLTYHKQPSVKGSFKFLSKLVKTEESLTGSERELFHCINNSLDILLNINSGIHGANNLVFDRSPLSTIAYGNMYGVSEVIRDNIIDVYRILFRHKFLNKKINYIFLTADKPFSGADDSDIHEKITFPEMKKAYDDLYLEMTHGKYSCMLSNQEEYHRIDITGMDTNQVYVEVIKKVFSN